MIFRKQKPRPLSNHSPYSLLPPFPLPHTFPLKKSKRYLQPRKLSIEIYPSLVPSSWHCRRVYRFSWHDNSIFLFFLCGLCGRGIWGGGGRGEQRRSENFFLSIYFHLFTYVRNQIYLLIDLPLSIHKYPRNNSIPDSFISFFTHISLIRLFICFSYSSLSSPTQQRDK